MDWEQANARVAAEITQTTRTLRYSPSIAGKAQCNFRMLWSCSNIIPKSCQLSQNTKVDCSYPSFLLPYVLVQREQLRIGVSGAKSHSPFSDPRQGEALLRLLSYSTSLFLNYWVRLYCLILERNPCCFSLWYLWPAMPYSLTVAYLIKVREVQLFFAVLPSLIRALLKPFQKPNQEMWSKGKTSKIDVNNKVVTI